MVRADRSLAVFPVISGLAGIVSAVIFFGAGAGVIAASDTDWLGLPFLVIGVYVVVSIAISSESR